MHVRRGIKYTVKPVKKILKIPRKSTSQAGNFLKGQF
jgi:hypothetical protein